MKETELREALSIESYMLFEQRRRQLAIQSLLHHKSKLTESATQTELIYEDLLKREAQTLTEIKEL